MIDGDVAAKADHHNRQRCGERSIRHNTQTTVKCQVAILSTFLKTVQHANRHQLHTKPITHQTDYTPDRLDMSQTCQTSIPYKCQAAIISNGELSDPRPRPTTEQQGVLYCRLYGGDCVGPRYNSGFLERYEKYNLLATRTIQCHSDCLSE